MQTEAFVAIIVVAALVLVGLFGFGLFLNYNQARQLRASENERRAHQAQLLREEADRARTAQQRQLAAEQARRDQAAQEGIFRGPRVGGV
jgi:uncharacterized protein HemX